MKTAVLVSRPFHGIVLQFMPNHVHDGPPSRQGLISGVPIFWGSAIQRQVCPECPQIDMLYVLYGPQCTDLVPVARKKAHSLEADELSDLPVSKYVSFGLSEAPFRGVEHAWKPQALMREMHL